MNNKEKYYMHDSIDDNIVKTFGSDNGMFSWQAKEKLVAMFYVALTTLSLT